MQNNYKFIFKRYRNRQIRTSIDKRISRVIVSRVKHPQKSSRQGKKSAYVIAGGEGTDEDRSSEVIAAVLVGKVVVC